MIQHPSGTGSVRMVSATLETTNPPTAPAQVLQTISYGPAPPEIITPRLAVLLQLGAFTKDSITNGIKSTQTEPVSTVTASSPPVASSMVTIVGKLIMSRPEHEPSGASTLKQISKSTASSGTVVPFGFAKSEYTTPRYPSRMLFSFRLPLTEPNGLIAGFGFWIPV